MHTTQRRAAPWYFCLCSLALLSSGCGDDDPRVTCGAGTMLGAAAQCVPAESAGGPPAQMPPVEMPPAQMPPAQMPPAQMPKTGGALHVVSLTTEYQPGATVYVSHPLDVTLGLAGKGMAEQNLLVTLGLMEKPAPGASDAELANLKSCVLASADVPIRGDGSEQFVRFNGVVPPECLAGAAERTFNFQVITDLVEEKTGSDPTNKLIVFNEREKDNPMVQGCQLLRSDADTVIPGCAIDLVVKPTPGVNVVLSEARPSTSVIVAYPPQRNPDIPDGQLESPHAAFIIHTELQAFGQDDDDPNAGTLPAPVNFTYDVRAMPDDANVGWMPLVVDPNSNPQPIPVVRPGEKRDFSGEMHMSPELRTELMLGGRWFGLERFTVRVCATAAFEEKGGDPVAAGPDGKADNCRWFPVRLVRATTAPTLANAFAADKNYGIKWGSKKAVAVTLDAYSHNQADLAGATSDQDVNLGVDSLFGDFSVFHVWGTATATMATLATDAAPAKPAKAGLDTGIKIFNAKLFATSPEGTAEISYTKDVSFAKEKCQSYVFAALIVPVETRFCVSGETGIDLTMRLAADYLRPSVRPYARIGSSTRATIHGGAFRVSIEGDVDIVRINGNEREDGAAAKLRLTGVTLDPPSLKVDLDVSAQMGISTLSAGLYLDVETLEPDICSKKIFGHRFRYPCVDWETVEHVRIARFEGYRYEQKLLKRVVTATLQ